jgi:hypothetical protein
MNIETIEEFVKWAEGVPYLEVFKGAWLLSEDEDEISWELLPNIEFKYSSEVLIVHRKEGLAIVNIDNGYGETITMVFLESEEIKIDGA